MYIAINNNKCNTRAYHTRCISSYIYRSGESKEIKTQWRRYVVVRRDWEDASGVNARMDIYGSFDRLENERTVHGTLCERTLLPIPGTCIIIAKVYLPRYIYRPPRIRNPCERARRVRAWMQPAALSRLKKAQRSPKIAHRARGKQWTPCTYARTLREKYVADVRSESTVREIASTRPILAFLCFMIQCIKWECERGSRAKGENSGGNPANCP